MTGPPILTNALRKALKTHDAHLWPWELSGVRFVQVAFWNSVLAVERKTERDHFIAILHTNGQERARAAVGSKEAQNLFNLARSGLNLVKDKKLPSAPVTLSERLTRLIGRCKPSYGDVVRDELTKYAKEAEAMHNRAKKQHAAICEALVLLRETASRKGLTHADKDLAIEQASEALEGAL